MSITNINNSSAISTSAKAHILNPNVDKPNDAQKQISNNAEEIAAMFSSRMQKKKSEKEKNQSQSRNLNRRINSIEQINALSSILDVSSSIKKKQKDIFDTLKSGGSLQDWTDSEKNKGSEPAETFLALKLALLSSDDKTRPEIERAIDSFTRENGTSIQTSFNVASTVAKAYPDQSFAKTMRKTIGEGNQNNYDTRAIVDLLLKNFGEDDFGRSLDTYSRSIVTDMNNLTPSTDPKRLSDVFDNLHAANGVRSLVNECDDLLLDFKRQGHGSK